MTTMTSSWQTRHLLLIILIALGTGLGGCATTKLTPAQQQQKQAEEIYTEGREALQAQNYEQASNRFKSLEIYYPDSPYNHQAQMELAYAYFKAGDYSSSIATTERLIRNFPDSDNLDYPRYLKALASFEQAVDMLEHGEDQDAAALAAETALQYFDELARYHPDSKYQQDADKRVAYLKEQLAQHEVMLARSLIEQGNHASAIVHARHVVENYPQTHSAADALAIVDMGYEIMAINKADADQGTPKTPTVPAAISAAVPLVTAAVAADNRDDEQQQETDQAPADEAVTVITAHSSGDSDEGQMAGAHTVAWIMQQPADHYTIQLISMVKDDSLKQFITRHKLDDRVAYYRKRVKGKVRHTLIYGVYPNTAEAHAAIDALPQALRDSKPWVQNIKAVQQAITDFDNESSNN